MATRHLIIGGGTAGINAMRTIREEESTRSEITLVSAERPYSRMVLPYYLDRSIAESHVFTATASVLGQWGVKTLAGRRAAHLDVKANACTLDDGTKLEYDDCLIATGSSPVRAPVPGAELTERWLKQHGVAVRAGAQLTKIEDVRDGKKRLSFKSGPAIQADVVIMATGIRTNLDWLKDSGITINRGVVVDSHLRSNVA